MSRVSQIKAPPPPAPRPEFPTAVDRATAAMDASVDAPLGPVLIDGVVYLRQAVDGPTVSLGLMM